MTQETALQEKTTTPELLPCPFCGNQSAIGEDSFLTCDKIDPYVVCANASCPMEGLHFLPEEWSKRAITAATAESQSRVAELEQQLATVRKALKRADETIDELNGAAIERGGF